jgi:hypothetical protein
MFPTSQTVIMANLRVVAQRDKWLSLLFLCDNAFIFLSRYRSTIHKNQEKEGERVNILLVGCMFVWFQRMFFVVSDEPNNI